eukprot:550828-Alexandrium_andersonii.AAC.1
MSRRFAPCWSSSSSGWRGRFCPSTHATDGKWPPRGIDELARVDTSSSDGEPGDSDANSQGGG